MSTLGLIQVYTGNGKGKTTASFGLAFRACGHGFRVCMIQFMKNNSELGEVKASHLLPTFTIRQFGRNEFVDPKSPAQVDRDLAAAGWILAKSFISSGEYELVILDEIIGTVNMGLISVEEVVSFLREQPNRPEIVLTGRNVPQEILEIADLVTEMKEVRHPYHKGIPARKGIEY